MLEDFLTQVFAAVAAGIILALFLDPAFRRSILAIIERYRFGNRFKQFMTVRAEKVGARLAIYWMSLCIALLFGVIVFDQIGYVPSEQAAKYDLLIQVLTIIGVTSVMGYVGMFLVVGSEVLRVKRFLGSRPNK